VTVNSVPKSFFPENISGTLTIAQKRAVALIKNLRRTPFEKCYEASPNGHNLPRSPGIYAFRHRDKRVLYVGKSTNIGTRFRPGHSVFVDLFFGGYALPDIRIFVFPIHGDYLQYLDIIEAVVISILEPEFNKKRYTLTEIASMVAVRSFTIPSDIQLTDILPSSAVVAIQDFAQANNLQPNQVIELALTQFLDYDAVTLDGYEHLTTFAQLKNQVDMLKAELEGLRQQS
jgi:hypothetical protein